MAYIGLRHVVAAPIETETAGTMPTYGTGVLVGRAMMANVNFDRADVTLEADDTTVESDNSIVGGTVQLGIDDLLDEARVALLGDKAVEGDEGSYDEIGKAAPYVGIGYVRQRVYNGKTSYRAMWIIKTQFGGADENAQTKGRTTNFQTPTINGSIMGVQLEDGEMHFRRRSKFFDKASEAIAWVNQLANYTEPAAAAAAQTV